MELGRGAHLGTPFSANHTAAASQPTGRIAKAASWLHLSRVSPAVHPPERPSHTHTPKPGFGGRGRQRPLYIVHKDRNSTIIVRVVSTVLILLILLILLIECLNCQGRPHPRTTRTLSTHFRNPLEDTICTRTAAVEYCRLRSSAVIEPQKISCLASNRRAALGYAHVILETTYL